MLLTEETPFINYLISKRHKNNIIEKNMHIAAFVPSIIKKRQCFL